MNPTLRMPLGLAGIYFASLSPHTLSPAGELPRRVGQGTPTACSSVDTTYLKGLTGRKDYMGQGPTVVETSVPGAERTACMYLEVTFEVTASDSIEIFKPRLLGMAKTAASKLK